MMDGVSELLDRLRALDWDFGTVPAWFTLGTIVIAVVTLWMGRRDAAREPAAHVYAVVVDYKTGQPADNPFTDVEVRNDGKFPIFEPSVQLWSWGKERRLTSYLWGREYRLTWRLWPIHKWLHGKRLDWANGSHAPPRCGTEVARLEGLNPRPKEDLRASSTPPIVLMFRDGNGRLWVRWPSGGLKRVSPSLWRNFPKNESGRTAKELRLRMCPQAGQDGLHGRDASDSG